MIVDLEEPLYSYEKLISDAKALAEQYHKIVQYVTIGRSHDNRDILMLKLGTGKRYFLVCSGVHGRETVNPVVMMKMTEYYAEQYMSYRLQKENMSRMFGNPSMNSGEEYGRLIFGKCIRELLHTYTILIIPMLNPDGYTIALQGYEAIREEKLREKAIKRKLPYEEWKFNARGVDINRNFPSRLWRPKGPGDYAASENETRALISVFHQYRLKGFVDLHSRGKSIYYYRSRMPELYNERQQKAALRLKEITKYELMPPGDEVDPGDTGGNTVHYFSEHFYRLALTIETVEEEATFPLNKEYRASTFEELKLLFFELGSQMV